MTKRYDGRAVVPDLSFRVRSGIVTRPLGANGGLEAGTHADDGLASDAELRALSEADGAAAEKLYLTLMTAYHSGAITMADIEIRDGQDPDVLQLAKDVAVSQQAEITTIKKLLGRL